MIASGPGFRPCSADPANTICTCPTGAPCRHLPTQSARRADDEAAELLGRMAALVDIALDIAALPDALASAMGEARADYRRWLATPLRRARGAAE
jgi:hypothetical protein